MESSPALPSHYELTRGQALVSSGALTAAFLLLGRLGWRLVTDLDLGAASSTRTGKSR